LPGLLDECFCIALPLCIDTAPGCGGNCAPGLTCGELLPGVCTCLPPPGTNEGAGL
jgi:hypothetical protein